MILVTVETLEGDFVNLYSGESKEDAKKTFNERASKPATYLNVWTHSNYSHRKRSKQERIEKPVKAKKKRTSKKS